MITSISYTPSICPVDVQYVIAHSRIDNTADLGLVQDYAATATEIAENYLSRYLITRTVTWTVAHDRHHHPQQGAFLLAAPWQWPDFSRQHLVHLPRPASAVSAVTMGVWGEPDVLLAEGVDYEMDYATQVARLRWISQAFRAQRLRDHLSITFDSGYGNTGDSVPAPIKHAIMLITTSLYENRGDTPPELYSDAVQNMLAPHRFVYFG